MTQLQTELTIPRKDFGMTQLQTPSHTITLPPILGPVGQALLDAKMLISDEANWWNGGRGGGSYCSLTAFRSDPFNHRAQLILAEAMGCFVIAISNFNDTHTHAEVMAAFDAAIALAAERGI